MLLQCGGGCRAQRRAIGSVSSVGAGPNLRGGVSPGVFTARIATDWGDMPGKKQPDSRDAGRITDMKSNAFVRSIGSSAAVTKRDAKWYPYKGDMPKLTSGMDHDYAISFPNPLRPSKCYSWDHSFMEEEAGMRARLAFDGDTIPALFRVHIADMLLHEIDVDGNEVLLEGNHLSLKDEEVRTKTDGYIHFTLYKEGLRTTQAIYYIAHISGLKLTSFSWAVGMDAKAATTQTVSVEVEGTVGETMVKLVDVFGRGKIPRGIVRVGSARYAAKPVYPGETRGKSVSMMLRNVRGAAPEVYKKMESLAAKGFVNYFGVEKFGMTQGPKPADIAVHVYNGQYKEALMEVLRMEAFMNPSVERILITLERTEQVSQSMIDMVPSHLPHVRGLIVGLLKHKSFKAAYHSVAPSMRRMWESALSARVWNKLAATRIERYGGDAAVEGDVVWLREETKPHLVTKDDVAQGRYSIREVVIPVPGVPVFETKTSFFPDLNGCDINAVMDALAEHGVHWPFRLSKEHKLIPPTYRHLVVGPMGLRCTVHENEVVNERVIVTDVSAGAAQVWPGSAVNTNDYSVSERHALQTRGLAGMMYTFDWNCSECDVRNLFLRDTCEGCGASKDLSVTLADKQYQKAINGDLKNCNSAHVQFAIPHSSYPSVALRDVFEMHAWRFYPDGYFYQDVLEPLLQFHLDKHQVSLPPTKTELKRDLWVVEAKKNAWHDGKLHGIFSMPVERIDEWTDRWGWSVSPNYQTDMHFSQVWKEESEAWWNIPLASSLERRQKRPPLMQSQTGGSLNVTQRVGEVGGRSVPPKQHTLPITPLPAAVRNTRMTPGFFTNR
eukprot:Rhum_TRINITY_DN21011_c0_g1::Rhum_TRINITY_DN21011_c0_g1_i1::g.172906::m.172906/K06176/truD, PUS7; tRNA pseudouridine13 synthase